jgi:hypothetical protein
MLKVPRSTGLAARFELRGHDISTYQYKAWPAEDIHAISAV